MALNLDKTKIGRKILLFAIVCGVLGVADFFRPASLLLYTLQTKVNVRPVSGDTVVVGIDSPSINAIGRWPWPRDVQADLLKSIDRYDPKAVYVDVGYQGLTTTKADDALRRTLEGMKAPAKVIALADSREDGSARAVFSHVSVTGTTGAVTALMPNILGYVWELPTSIQTERGNLQSVAASIANLDEPRLSEFRVDYGYDPNSIPIFAAKDIFAGSIDQAKLRGKTVIIGVTDATQNDIHSMPGWGTRPGVLFHVMGAETLKDGMPANWGWVAFFVFAAAICAFHLTLVGLQFSRYINWVGAGSVLGVSTWLTAMHIGNDPLPSLALLGCTSFYISRQKAALIRSSRHAETGFSNMTGYMVEEVISNALFVGATLHRPETRLGFVRPEDQMTIMKEVGRRLSSVIDEKQLTHNEEQQFLWEMPNIGTGKLAEHLEGLRQMFAQPLVIDGRKIDIDISFGVDRDFNDNVKNRMESALAASVEASKSQSTFKIATSTGFEAHLKSQFAAELKTAIANKDVEPMLEAQKSLASDLVESASVSIRWIHPAHGEIATGELFALARESGNLDTLTEFLCEQAMGVSAKLADRHPDFTLSIKVSMDVILSPGFGERALAMADAAHCKRANIIFDVIDIHAHKHNMSAQKAFNDLQTKGFRVGIGEFGKTDADIDLLKLLKPDEIFLIKSFSAELLGSTGNQMFAVSALRIARASNIVTTADGIDDRDVLAALRVNGCDRGKGKIISMPLNTNDFISTYVNVKIKKVC